MTNVHHVIGPPGTGKTTYLAGVARDAIEKYGGKNVLICSLTRGAASEIGGRDTGVPDENVGTLHSHAFRALGQPKIAESMVKFWNEDHPEYMITSAKKGGVDDPMDETSGDSGDGDDLLSEINNLRAALIPESKWRAILMDFWGKWKEWKGETGYLDFTDLIEKCIADIPVAPGSPLVMIGDEAQDWSALEAKLFRDHWGAHASEVIMAGDGDQTLYSWRGADPNIFMDHPVPADQHKVLEQSWRVPAAVHETAHEWIRQIERREDVNYRPADSQGECVLFDCSSKNVEPLIDDIEDRIKAGETCMILASCSFILKPTIKVLRDRGIPFHNPYRKIQSAWNPLQRRKDAVTSSDRLLAYLAPVLENRTSMPQWTADEFESWACLLRSGDILRHGTKKEFTGKGDFKFPENVTLGWFQEIFVDFARDCEQIMECDLDWLENAMLSSKLPPMLYPLKVMRMHGAEALRQEPKVVVGTIHSVKGGEADNVYVFPDISPSGMREWENDGRDSIIRMFYVAMTRAKNRLALCYRGSPYAVEWL